MNYHGINPYFDQYQNFGEQDLLEDLIIESISIYGVDMMYIPRVLNAYDAILTEDAQSSYTTAIPMAMYVRNVDGFEGDSTFLSKFGYEVRDQVTFSFSKRIWQEEVGVLTGKEVPKEGDLVYFPLANKLFQIRFVNYKPFFYQLGTLPMYDITCELFEYSNENIDTGIPAIDRIVTDFSTDILNYAFRDETGFPMCDEDGNYIVDESYGNNDLAVNAQNNAFTQENTSNNVINFNELDPFNEKVY
jgi:hypothetical protein